jgi:hypothetical protein
LTYGSGFGVVFGNNLFVGGIVKANRILRDNQLQTIKADLRMEITRGSFEEASEGKDRRVAKNYN